MLDYGVVLRVVISYSHLFFCFSFTYVNIEHKNCHCNLILSVICHQSKELKVKYNLLVCCHTTGLNSDGLFDCTIHRSTKVRITWLTWMLIMGSYFIYFYYKFIYFNRRLITLQYCISFSIYQHESNIHISMPFYRTVLWTLWERERVRWFGRMALLVSFFSIL